MDMRLTHGAVTEFEDGDGSVMGIDISRNGYLTRVIHGVRLETE